LDLIAQVIGAALAFFMSIIGNIFAHDICTSADSICAKIIKAAASRLAAFDQESAKQEWLGDLHERQTVIEKYRHAVGCFLAAPGMRRCALEAPFVAEPPGLVWKERANSRTEARWQPSLKAIEEGYSLKSIKLWSGYKVRLTAKHKQFIIATTQEILADHDKWLYHRDEYEAESDRIRQKIDKLMDAGHTRQEAVDILGL